MLLAWVELWLSVGVVSVEVVWASVELAVTAVLSVGLGVSVEPEVELLSVVV